MKRNYDTANKVQYVYDLTQAELDKFYRGSGEATLVVNLSLDIIVCNYAGRANDDPAFLAAMAEPGNKWLEGIMSSCQFCCMSEGRIS